jgi:4-hydroxy-2-oxoheptanedioate aldolase
MANVGFDVLLLDMQHGMAIGPDRAALWLQTVSTTDTMPMVRVPWNEPFFIQWVLDAGAYGVVVPLVNSREEAAKAGGACRYPPVGYRSAGANRARLYGGIDYFKQANKEIICLVQIEDINTVAHVDDLADASGIDGFYIGPSDLAVTMGLGPADYLKSAKHAEACSKVLDTAKNHGLIAGIHCLSPHEVIQRTSQGFIFCPAICGVGALAIAANAALQEVRGERMK